MPWSTTQRQRLAFEKSLLEKYFRKSVTWIDPTGDTKVEVQVTCSNDKQYTLRVYLLPDFPNSVPPMIVKTPGMTTLKTRDGTELEEVADHTLESKDGCTLICHFRPLFWKDNNMLYEVFMKGLIWLEAYEAHLRTGANLSKYLAEMWLWALFSHLRKIRVHDMSFLWRRRRHLWKWHVLCAIVGNLRSTTKETTTTSIDRARTGTRTSFSVGEMKVKKRSACTTTATTLCGIQYIDLFFITFFKRCLRPYQHDEYFLVLTFSKQNVQNYSKFVLAQMARSECSSCRV